MALKRECGRGDLDALEVYPVDPDIVNVANMRHLFFPPTPLSFKWKSEPSFGGATKHPLSPTINAAGTGR
jgi:hypothetical protein